MATSFHRLTQTLRQDNGRLSGLGLLAGSALVCAWTFWAFHATVTRYETTDIARVEVNGSAYPVQAGISGQVLATNLVLGKTVHAGDVLAELDSESQRLELREAQIKLTTIEPQLSVLRAQMSAQKQGGAGERNVLAFSTEEARAKYREAEAQAALAEQNADRAAKLRADGLISESNAQQAIAEAKSRKAAAEDLRVAIARLEPELQVRESDRGVKLNEIAADIAELEAGKAATQAAIQRLEYEIERRRIRAAVDGRLSDCAVLRPGSHVTEGERIGVILPSEALRVVAEFPPALAFGKLRAGQRARVKLKGFPWMQYGTLQAKVSRVAGEIRDGKVRVELALVSPSAPRIPLQHGLPGSVEIQVERISPAALLLRSAGQFIGAQ
jgi:membrane fusion protein (multidrug efflux system)